VTAVCAWISKNSWESELFIDDQPVEGIGIDLEEDTSGGITPLKLPGAFPSFLGIKLAPHNQPLTQEAFTRLPDHLRAALLPAIGGDEMGALPTPLTAPNSPLKKGCFFVIGL
jgi:hypothetical protein